MKVATPLSRVELPDGWVDESVIQFASAPSAEVVGDVAARPTAESSRRVVTILRLRNAPAPAEVLAQQLAGLKAQLPGLAVQAETIWRHPIYGDAPAVVCSHEVAPGRSTRQVHVIVSDGAKTTLSVTFSSDLRAFEQSLPEFRRIFESLELVPG